MLRPRVIPVLLINGRGLYKTRQFKDPKYVGDPINTVKIFNEKEVDEICVLDIAASIEKREPNIPLIREIAGECFMPMAYGGGVRTLEQARAVFNAGVEKIIINTLVHDAPEIVRTIADYAGASSVVISIDFKKKLLHGYEVYICSGKRATGRDPVDFAREMERLGTGEIFLQSIDRDGTMQGYDLELIHRVSGSVNIPIIACGGAGQLSDFASAIKNGASAVAAGSYFVFQGKHRAVLLSYPTPQEIESLP
jgi:cyclase